MNLEQFTETMTVAATTPKLKNLNARQLAALAIMAMRRTDPSPWGQAAWDFRELARRTNMPPPSLSRSLSQFSQAGFVEIMPNVKDHRKRLISLTQRGQDAILSLTQPTAEPALAAA